MPKNAAPAVQSPTVTNPILKELPAPKFELVGLHVIELNPENPARREDDSADMVELQASIQQHGIVQPVCLRELGKFPQSYRLVFGERRLRAARALGLSEIPALIYGPEAMSDERALEVALVENVQRKDPSPHDECRAYALLRDKYRRTLEDIAAHVGRSLAHVHRRLLLSNLSDAALVLVDRGLILAGAAEHFGRIENQEQQREALVWAMTSQGVKEAARLLDRLDVTPNVDLDKAWTGEPITAAMARAAVEFCGRDLSRAPWDIGATCEIAGARPNACMGCPQRTGAQAFLFAGAGKGDVDRCLDPKCWDAKLAAHRSVAIAQAKEDGATVLGRKECRALFGDGTTLLDSRFVDLDSPCELPGPAGSWRVRCRKALEGLEIFVAQDGAGMLHHLVERSALLRACKVAGIIKPEKPVVRDGDDAREANEKAALERARTLAGAVMVRLLGKVSALPLHTEEENSTWELLTRALLVRAPVRVLRDMALRHVGPEGTAEQALAKIRDAMSASITPNPETRAKALRGFAIELAALSAPQFFTDGLDVDDSRAVVDGVDEHGIPLSLAFAAEVFGISVQKLSDKAAAVRRGGKGKAKGKKPAKAKKKKERGKAPAKEERGTAE